jgi:mannose-6-phosphate isomerase-like protein (cupin superfamily)
VEWVSVGDVMALVVRSTCEPAATSFVTAPALPMQLGFVVYPEGASIAPHRHRATPRAVTGTPEFLLVRRGRCRVTFHPSGPDETRTVELSTGDALMILQGAHSLDFDESTVLLEIKQGPFLGSGEKEPL